MKNFLVFLCTVSLFFGVVGFAGATPITYRDTISFNQLISPTNSVSWNHLFDIPTDEILGGLLTVWLRDDDDLWPWVPEFALGLGDDGAWAFGEVDTRSYSYGVNVPSLEDGAFAIKLSSLGGDFFIDKSELVITYETSSITPAPVPEPATMLLFGCGLIGLAAVGRKKFQQGNTK